MIKRLKNMLGIESVKIDLEIPQEIEKKDQNIKGIIILTTLSDAEVESISIKLIEKYTRGRKEDKLIDEYVISKILVEEKVSISKGEEIKLPFDLPFKIVKSPMDELQGRNFLNSFFVGIAKKLKGVKSDYRIIAEVNIKGTTLHPFAEKGLYFR